MKIKAYLKWQHINRAITVLTFAIGLVGVPVALYQLNEIKNNQLSKSGDWALRYYDRINTGTNRSLSIAIQHNKPLLVPKGKFTEDDFDDFLGNFHDIGKHHASGVISDEDVCSNFYYGTQRAWENPEIQTYLVKIRTIDPTLFTGFDNLEAFVKACS
jgi:hypothetical protein